MCGPMVSSKAWNVTTLVPGFQLSAGRRPERRKPRETRFEKLVPLGLALFAIGFFGRTAKGPPAGEQNAR